MRAHPTDSAGEPVDRSATLLDLVRAVESVTRDDREVVEAVCDLLAEGRVRVRGQRVTCADR